jgi:uncharacterized protein (DUF58 family)
LALGLRTRPPGAPAGRSALSAFLERYLGVTVSGVGLAAVVVIGFLIARHQQSPPLYLFAYGLAFILISAFVLGRRRLAVTADRSTLPKRVREGQKVEIDVTLSARRRTTAVVFEEELDTHLGRSTRFPVTVLHGGEDAEAAGRLHGWSVGRHLVGSVRAHEEACGLE